MKLAIPLSAAQMAGSGFLVSSESALWLVTCAHLLTGARHSPPDWKAWSQALTVHTHDGGFTIALFGATGEPQFKWVPDGVSGDNVEDVITILLSDHQRERLKGFSPLGLENLRRPSLGQIGIGIGYPRFGQTFPQIPPEATFIGVVQSFGHQMIGLSGASAAGFSGGPMVGSGEWYGVISGNINSDTNAIAVEVGLLANQLFA